MDLSSATLKSATPGQILRDSSVNGLHARVTATGTKFYLYFRTRGGVERRPKLGDYPLMTVAQARQVAKDMLLEVAKGNDPSAMRQAHRVAHTVDELIDEYELKYSGRRKSGEKVVVLLRKHLSPKFGSMKVADVTFSDMDGLHAKMKDRPVLANRIIAYASKMFALAIRWKHRPDGVNPCKGVERYQEKKRKRYMSLDEAKAVATQLNLEAEHNPRSVAFIFLLILTGARKGEIAAARWDWLDGNVLRLPDSKTGARPVYLPPSAMDVVSRLSRTNGTITGLLDPKKIWNKVRVAAGCPDLRMHDLRHSFASAALQAGLSLSQIGELLGHASTQTTKRYAHLVEEAAHAAAAKTAETIQMRLQGNRHEAKDDVAGPAVDGTVRVRQLRDEGAEPLGGCT